MATSFSKSISRFTEKAESRLRAVARTATQEVIKEAQKTTGEGGRMRVKTGFLRASILAAIGAMPKGQTDNPDNKEYGSGKFVGQTPAATLLSWDPNKGEVLYIGWSANYARFREAHDHFLKTAVQNWDMQVAKASKRIK